MGKLLIAHKKKKDELKRTVNEVNFKDIKFVQNQYRGKRVTPNIVQEFVSPIFRFKSDNRVNNETIFSILQDYVHNVDADQYNGEIVAIIDNKNILSADDIASSMYSLNQVIVDDLQNIPLKDENPPDIFSLSKGVQINSNECVLNMLLITLQGTTCFKKLTLGELREYFGTSTPTLDMIHNYLTLLLKSDGF